MITFLVIVSHLLLYIMQYLISIYGIYASIYLLLGASLQGPHYRQALRHQDLFEGLPEEEEGGPLGRDLLRGHQAGDRHHEEALASECIAVV